MHTSWHNARVALLKPSQLDSEPFFYGVVLKASGRRLIFSTSICYYSQMEYLSAEERAQVRRAMALLAEAGRRGRKQDEPSEAGTGAR